MVSYIFFAGKIRPYNPKKKSQYKKNKKAAPITTTPLSSAHLSLSLSLSLSPFCLQQIIKTHSGGLSGGD